MTKFCKNCAHYGAGGNCTHPNNEFTSLVDGRGLSGSSVSVAGRKLTAASRARRSEMSAALFDSYIERVPFSGCWLWTGTLNEDGYGKFGKTSAHCVAYAKNRGAVPQGMELDHLCRVRCCVNPYHLEPVTHTENVLRGSSPSALWARRTHCQCGQPLEQYRNRRICRACKRAANRRSYATRGQRRAA